VYFFKEDGTACSSKTDNVNTILRVRKTTEGEIIIEPIQERDELEDDSYVNEANINNVGIWDGQKWNIKEVNCVYDSENRTCYLNIHEWKENSYCFTLSY